MPRGLVQVRVSGCRLLVVGLLLVVTVQLWWVLSRWWRRQRVCRLVALVVPPTGVPVQAVVWSRSAWSAGWVQPGKRQVRSRVMT